MKLNKKLLQAKQLYKISYTIQTIKDNLVIIQKKVIYQVR
jgi:hypothetical protein